MAKISLSGYGQNNSAVPSWLTSSEDAGRNPYAPPLSEAQAHVIASGVASAPVLGKIDSKPEVAPAFGHRDRNANPVKVPSTTQRR
ncbi:hypothetical protein L6654_24180 [Bradyrhizobium sp. WYCCWR 13023]|uniref:Uncharacterized protein n=1 Tax=Bradyrhizobium zhengyangense TaxID=2911009 RepID=A0A9X1RD35_9BRAD|nr:hypothetical protein [Bradyrhizobium zhengyangense]MCG2629726.1 hypothetical protein [Bradyrhizobium zhengyangense]